MPLKNVQEFDEPTLPDAVEGVAPEQALAAEDAAERAAAVQALFGEAHAMGAQLERLGVEPDRRVRELLLTNLSALGGPEVVAALVPLLARDEPDLRTAVCDALVTLDPQLVAPHVPVLLADADRDVRLMALTVARDLGSAEVAEWLVERLLTDDDASVCAGAVDLLAEVGTAAAVPALEAVRQRFADDDYLAFAVDVALANVSDR